MEEKGHPATRKRRILLATIAAIIATAVSSIAAEVLLRVLDLAPTQRIRSANRQEFSSLPGIYAPDQSIVARHVPALPHRVTINGLGYRGKNFPLSKPPGEIRILMTGDSFTFGDLVDDDKTLPYQLEELLRARCAPIRIINAGLAGSTIDAQSELIERATDLKPDIVVLVFHENDLLDLTASIWPKLTANRELTSRFPMSFILQALHGTAIYNVAKKAEFRFRELTKNDPFSAKPSAEIERQNLNRIKAEYAQRLLQIRDRLRSRSVDFIFALFPSYLHVGPPKVARPDRSDTVDWYDRAIVLWAEQTARQMGIPTLNLESGLYGGLASVEEGYLLPHDAHPSAKGYRIAAENFANFPPMLDAVSRKCTAPQ